jgi:hypothetical protein
MIYQFGSFFCDIAINLDTAIKEDRLRTRQAQV